VLRSVRHLDVDFIIGETQRQNALALRRITLPSLHLLTEALRPIRGLLSEFIGRLLYLRDRNWNQCSLCGLTGTPRAGTPMLHTLTVALALIGIAAIAICHHRYVERAGLA
jgi:hypothetical protein